MMTSSRGTALAAAALLAAGIFLPSGGAFAQSEYPSKTVRMIVTFPAGGGTDAVARFMAEEFSARLGQSFIIENIGGAAGSIGVQAAIDAEPDGYTLLHGTSGTLVNTPVLYEAVTFDAAKDLAPVGSLVSLYSVLLISNRLSENENITTLADFLEYAEANPGVLNFGSGGVGNGAHIAMEQIMLASGTAMEHIPFQGGAASSQALIAGDIDVVSSTTPEALPLVAGGNAVALAVSGSQRLESLPDVPTFAEAGLDLEYFGWHALFAPAGTPQAILQVLEEQMRDILSTDKAKEYLANQGLVITPSGGAELLEMLAQQQAIFATVVEAAGIAPS